MHSCSQFGITILAVLVCLSTSSITPGQVTTAQKYLITAKAGGVNLIEGEVTVGRTEGRSAVLVKGDEVRIGERVTTGADGRAEILMNPGSYIRLGANSSFEFASTELDDVRITLHEGSAILEVFGTQGFQVNLSTDTARFTLLQTGVYRINASKDGTSTVAVWKGKLRGGLDSSPSAGGGKIVSFDGKTYSVSKFDRDDQDALAVWSRERSKELSKISATLKPDRLRDPLISSFHGGRWDLNNSFGLWVFDPVHRSFCFLPFGYGWSSPYGFGFGRSIWYYNLPAVIYDRSRNSGIWNGRNSNSTIEPLGGISGPPSSGAADGVNRPVREPSRDVVPRQPTAEPRINVPRNEPMPASAPVRRTRDH